MFHEYLMDMYAYTPTWALMHDRSLNNRKPISCRMEFVVHNLYSTHDPTAATMVRRLKLHNVHMHQSQATHVLRGSSSGSKIPGTNDRQVSPGVYIMTVPMTQVKYIQHTASNGGKQKCK